MAIKEKKGYKLSVIHSTGKNNKEYFALVLDMGYTRKFLGFGAMFCAEIAGMYPNELAAACPLNGSIEIGEI